MAVQLHAFNWEVYTERVMPAFEEWLIEGDEVAVQQLFEQTRCALEERFLPDSVDRLRVWPRARALAQTLPRGPYSRREYHKLCSAEHFTALSDRYLYRHAPQLYQQSDALRSVWGAIIETFCLPWAKPEQQVARVSPVHAAAPKQHAEDEGLAHGEVISFLQSVGLNELAQSYSAKLAELEHLEQTQASPAWTEEPAAPPENELAVPETPSPEEEGEEEEEIIVAARGITIGDAPNLLHIRGWLASISVRAMALFEFLACGRRSMPFGFEAGEPFGAFAGYLTPDEVALLADSLEGILAPDQLDAEEDHITFRYQNYALPSSYRLVDEVLPTHATRLLEAIQKAATEGFGLICSVE